jgi:2-dehydro-3-deoxygluconokinase
MNSVFCFGELLLRLSPVLNGEWIRQASMPVYIGGAELNVAQALTRWQIPVSYGTVLPDNYLSKEISQHIQSLGIDTSTFLYNGNRIGTYYLPQGADMKNAGVIYDRAYSSFYELRPGQIDWDKALDGKTWFHFSAISPALTENVALVCKEGLQAAVQKGLYVSVDLNYREKLWNYGKQPVDVMPELVQYCDLVMGNIWAAEKMLGISLPSKLADVKESYVAHAEESSIAICIRYSKVKQVANTFRFDREEGLRYYASLFKHNHLYLSNEHQTATVVDKVGSGDCFMAGLIYGTYHQLTAQETIDFASAAAFNKLFTKGDATKASVEEIQKGYLNYA